MMRAALAAVTRRASSSAMVAAASIRGGAVASAPLRTAAFFRAADLVFADSRHVRKFQTNEEVIEKVNKNQTEPRSPGPYAVDGPDGEHDFEDVEEHKAGIDEILDYARTHEDKDRINAEHAAGLSMGAFAVDGPDGEHDFEDVEEHGRQVSDIIDAAAKMEDAATIQTQQRMRDATLMEAERHPEKDL